MKFFDAEEEVKEEYRCVHITHFKQKLKPTSERQSKKPFERYKDMKLAIKLIERCAPLSDEEESSFQPYNSVSASPAASFYST